VGGITGFIDHSNCLTEQDLINASTTLNHRGSNGNGFIFEKKEHHALGIANERSATIDLGDKAAQPLTSNCGQYVITFNGTIYNYLELRETLIKYGVIFSTLSDTEVILESYKRWGKAAFEKLDGSFAFVIFDKTLHQFLIARDEIGTKPLYYFKIKNCYAFGSEIRALLSYPVFEKKINKNAITTYFRYGFFTGEETIYEDVFKVKKGFLTTIDLHSGNSYEAPIKRPQKIADLLKQEEQNEEEIVNHIEDLLTESILKRHTANVPVGILLNGGFDNATVAAVLQKNQSKRIKTYTVGINSKPNETTQAKKIAEHLKTNHQEYLLNDEDAIRIVKDLPNVFEEPIGNSGAIPLLFLAAQTKKEIKVLLNTEGGDELFGGCRAYTKAIKFQKIAELNLAPFLKTTIINLLQKYSTKTKAIINAKDLLDKYVEINACFTTEQLERLIPSANQIKPKAFQKDQDIKNLLTYDLDNLLPNDLLFKSDKCLMHFGIENRDALLKTELINYLKTLDAKWFIKNGEQKYLLKKITKKYIPSELMQKPIGSLKLPLALWLKTIFKPFVDDYITTEKLNEHQLLNVAEVLKIKAAFKSNSSTYNAQKLWLILQFQMWYERWIKTS
jgi:asparagine synthase (glutamine-hydrolysing)